MSRPFLKIAVFGLILYASTSSEIWAQPVFNAPESVVYDVANERYLVSNAGDGKILEVDTQGMLQVFNDSQNGCRGLQIIEGSLYAACNAGVAVMDLATGQTTSVIAIADRGFLNDVAADTSGHLYVTDSQEGKVFQITLSNQSWTTFVADLMSPNGLLFDEAENRLLLCSFRNNAPIQSISLADTSVATLVETNLANLDGLARDLDGNIYVSSWGSGAIHRFESTFNAPPEIVSPDHDNPADIFFNTYTHQLAVPNFGANTFALVAVTPPPAVVLGTPEDGAGDQSTTLTFTWKAQPVATHYHLQVASGSDFSANVFEDSTLVESSAEVSSLAGGVMHVWRVRAKNEHGSGPWSRVQSFTTTVATSDEKAGQEHPSAFSLHGNYPNPFNMVTTIVFDLPEAAYIHVDIVDLMGRKVGALQPQRIAAGVGRAFEIDASDLASGAYLYHVYAEMPRRTMMATGHLIVVR